MANSKLMVGESVSGNLTRVNLPSPVTALRGSRRPCDHKYGKVI